MKKLILFVAGLLASFSWAELVFEDFDHYAANRAITDYPGWKSLLGKAGAQAGRVRNDIAFSPPNALDLPWPNGLLYNQSLAVYNNFSFTYPKLRTGSIIRASARLYRDNLNQNVSMMLGWQSNALLTVKSDSLRNHIVINTHTTAVNFTTGRYATITVYYDMKANRASLDYDHTNVMSWRALPGMGVATQFNMLWFSRSSAGVGTEGRALVDDAMVEVFPFSTLGWWRFEEGQGAQFQKTRITEHTGRFLPGWRWGLPGESESDIWRPTAWDLLSSPGFEAHNRHSVSYPSTRMIWQATNFPAFENWTIEFIAKINPGATNWVITDYYNTDDYDSRIILRWNCANSNLAASLRDMLCNNPTHWSSHGNCGQVPADGQWHHIAFVKQFGELRSYVDYQYAWYGALNQYGSNAYSFATNAQFRMGGTRAGDLSAGTNVFLDEARLSNEDLTPAQFLAIARSKITAFSAGAAASNLGFRAMTIPWERYVVQHCTNLSSGQWKTNRTFMASNFLSDVSMTRSNWAAAAYRIYKQ